MKNVLIFKFVTCVSLVALLLISGAVAQDENVVSDLEKELEDLVNNEMKVWVYNEIVTTAIKLQNIENQDLTLTEKKTYNRRWHQGKRKSSSPLIKKALYSPLSKYLAKIQEESEGVYTEIIITDEFGINVGQSIISDSYWQGEKDFWKNTFETRSYATYIEDIDFNDNTQMFQAEVSFMIIIDDQPVGVVYAGVDVEQLQER